jgi:hypothetical protein
MLPAIDQKKKTIRKKEGSEMKNLILNSTLFLGATVLMGLSAQAQNIKVNIPFAFEANGKSLPAGDYTVTESTSNGGGLYSMRNMETHAGVLLSGSHPIAYGTSEAKLVFRQAADGFYLTEVWDGAMGRAVQCPRGRSSILASTKVVINAKK